MKIIPVAMGALLSASFLRAALRPELVRFARVKALAMNGQKRVLQESEQKIIEHEASCKRQRDEEYFLTVYRMMLASCTPQVLKRFPFEIAYKQLQDAVAQNKELVKNPALAIELVERCQTSYEIFVEEPEVPRLTPLQEIIRFLTRAPRRGTYQTIKEFTPWDNNVQMYMSAIATLLVERGANLSGLNDEFPTSKHADRCLSCHKLRNGMLDKREAPEK